MLYDEIGYSAGNLELHSPEVNYETLHRQSSNLLLSLAYTINLSSEYCSLSYCLQLPQGRKQTEWPIETPRRESCVPSRGTLRYL